MAQYYVTLADMHDLAVAVLAALVVTALAVLGTHISSNKRWHRITAVILGVAGVVLIGLQSWRSHRAQEALQEKVSRIEQNTLNPPNVIVQNVIPEPAKRAKMRLVRANSFAVAPGKSPYVNITYRNVGDLDATGVAIYGRLKFVDLSGGDARRAEDLAFENLYKEIAFERHPFPVNIVAGSDTWSTVRAGDLELIESDFKKTSSTPPIEFLTRDRHALLFMVVIQYSDKLGKRSDLQFCRYIESARMMALCVGHNTAE